MTLILAGLATYWFWETMCAMAPRLHGFALLLLPVIAYGALALPLWALAAPAIAIVIVLARRLEITKVRTTIQAPKQRRSNLPPLP